MKKQRVCKDCRTDNIIFKVLPKGYDTDDISTELCSTCLQSRAQLQNMKEDKLSFPKLLAKIRNETEKRVRSEIASVDSMQRMRWGSYKGVSGWSTIHENMSQYWIEQLTQVKETT